MGGSLGMSKSGSSQSAKSSTNVFGPQASALSSLYNKALSNLNTNQYQSQIADQAGAATQLMNNLFSQNSQANNFLASGGSYGDTTGVRDKLLGMMGGRSNMGTMYENIVGGQGNTYVDPLIKQMQGDSAQNVSTLQNANAMDAADMGQSGSNRQAMQNAMFANQANKDLSTQEAEMRKNAYDTDLQMKMGIAQQADTNHQSEQDRLLQMLQGANEARATSVGNSEALGSLAQNLMNPWTTAQQSQWNPLNNVANIIGSAIMTGNSKGSGNSKSKGFGTSGGMWG